MSGVRLFDGLRLRSGVRFLGVGLRLFSTERLLGVNERLLGVIERFLGVIERLFGVGDLRLSGDFLLGGGVGFLRRSFRFSTDLSRLECSRLGDLTRL